MSGEDVLPRPAELDHMAPVLARSDEFGGLAVVLASGLYQSVLPLRDAMLAFGDAPLARWPGTSAVARSAASSIRSRRSISSPRYSTNDASSVVLPGRIRAQNAASLRAKAWRQLTGARVIT